MEEIIPNWSSVHQKLARARQISEAKARSLALQSVIEDVITVFETWAPTEWEAHFLLHAIRHVENGYPAAAAEEITSVLKPRQQQTALETLHSLEVSGITPASARTGGRRQAGRRQASGRTPRPVL